MAKADYKCDTCGHVEEHDASDTHEEGFVWCVQYHGEDEHGPALSALCTGRMHRQWTPPHTGRGSSGEPPR